MNLTSQLEVLHAIYPLKQRGKQAHVAFLAGAGTNNAFTNYSAYAASKVALIKMCELLNDEAPDLNVFIVGPGFVKTKNHNETIKAGIKAGENYHRVKAFFRRP